MFLQWITAMLTSGLWPGSQCAGYTG